MNRISSEDQQILNSLQTAVTEALERKRRLGQYAVVWRDGKPNFIGGEPPQQLRQESHSNGNEAAGITDRQD